MPNTVSRVVNDDVLSRIIQIESGGKVKIKASTSSATGLGQFLDGTWIATVTKHRPDLIEGRTRQGVLDLRYNASIMIDMLARFTEDNARALGPTWTPGDLYLAHFAGSGTARQLMRADQDAPATTIFSPAAARANPTIIPGKTVGQVRAWAARKMAAAGGKDWIAQYYQPSSRLYDEPVAPRDLPVDMPDDHDEEERKKPPIDPQVYAVQAALDGMNYKVGDLDGLWGGFTSGAIAAFINDRPGDEILPIPQSYAGFRRVYPRLWEEIQQAEADQFTRPISKHRANASIETVAQTAPEVVPVQRGFVATVWAGVIAMVTAIANAASKAWDWFTGVAGEDAAPGLFQKGLGYLGMVPPFVWIALAAFAFGFIAFYFLKPGRDGIVHSVQNAERP